MELNRCYLGDAASVLRTFEDESVHCCVTSPPYFSLRDYNVPGQIGQEEDASEYIARLVDVFSDVYRVLRKDGTCWIVIGDSYAGRCGVISKGRCGFGDRKNLHTVRKGAKEKDLLGIPWMLAFALRDAGWYLRQDIIWAKANPMPAPMKDRCISSHEHILLLSKSPRYYFDYKAIMEEAVTQEDWNPGIRFGGSKYGDSIVGGGTYSGNPWVPKEEDGRFVRNKRDVWTVATYSNKEAHFATYPPKLIEPCVLAGCPEGGIVLDCFMGSGTTGIVARNLHRNFVGIELNPEYRDMAERRIFNLGENLFNQK